MNIKHYTYRVTWSSEDEQHVGLCVEFPSLSWLADDPQTALDGIITIVAEVVNDLKENKENVPVPLSERTYSGEFRVRIPPEVHRSLVIEASEKGISMNRLANAKLTMNL